jgi:threonine/homoserine/homoserine lactone efflux protein
MIVDLHLYAAFALAVTALMLLPGPNVALIVANSVSHGVRLGLLTVAGTASAMLVQLAVTAAGLGAVLGAAGVWFGALRWVGVGYLMFLAWQAFRAPAADLNLCPQAPDGRRVFARGFLVSLTNPKTLFFYAAFFPQFLTPERHGWAQIAVLAVTFVVIAVVIDSGWAVLASRARKILRKRQVWGNRISGGILAGAGLGLALSRAR